MNQFPPSPRVFHLDRFEFFRNFSEIFASQGAPPRYQRRELEGKNFIYVNSTTQRCPNKIIKIFQLEGFFHLPPVSLTPVTNLELRISPRIIEKIRNGPNGIIRSLGEIDSCWKLILAGHSWLFKIIFQLQRCANRADGGSWTGGREDGSAQGSWPGGGAQLGHPWQTSPGYPVIKI